MKGKEAAAAARRRVAELELALADERKQVSEVKRAAAQREAGLRTEVARLSGALERDVKRLADDRVREAEERITKAWHDERARTKARLVEALHYLTSIVDLSATGSALERLADLLEIPVADLLTNISIGRYGRRSVGHFDVSDLPKAIGGDQRSGAQRDLQRRFSERLSSTGEADQ